MSISQVLNCLFVCVGKFSVAKVQNNIFPASPPKYFFQLSPDFFRGTLRIRCSSSLLSNVPHVARVSKEFVLIARQCTARCVCYENELLLYNNLCFTQRKWGKAGVYALKEQTAPSPGQSRLPFQGVLQPPRTMRALLFRFLLGAPPNRYKLLTPIPLRIPPLSGRGGPGNCGLRWHWGCLG